jgi:hypothetical protein
MASCAMSRTIARVLRRRPRTLPLRIPSTTHVAAEARQSNRDGFAEHFFNVVLPPSVFTSDADRCLMTNGFGQQKFWRFHWTTPAANAALRAEFEGRLSVLREPRRLRGTGGKERRSLECRGPGQGVRDARSLQRADALHHRLCDSSGGLGTILGDVIADAFEIIACVRGPSDAHQPR